MYCDTCAYWERRDSNHENIKRCNKAIQLFDAEEWQDNGDKIVNAIKSEYKNQMMFTQDASSYHASLYTREDFFCAHWTAYEEHDYEGK